MIPLSRPHPQASYFVPEVVQISMMDCGPAALLSLLSGFGISVNYGRLREACQTSIDGTSISTMDEIANFLGLETEEMMLPVDHLLLDAARALPAIVVVNTPNGAHHFVVIWSVAGPWVQVMDPAEGRYWLPRSELFKRLYLHQMNIPASAWRFWVGEPELRSSFEARLAALKIARRDRERLCAAALASPRWAAMAALDAATRMTASLVNKGAVPPGATCLAMIERQIVPGEDGMYPLIADEYRSVWRAPAHEQVHDEDETLVMRGVVLVRARGRHRGRRADPARDVDDAAPDGAGAAGQVAVTTERDGGPDAVHRTRTIDAAPGPMPAELAATLTEAPVRPWRTLVGLLVEDGLATPVVLGVALVVSAVLLTVDAVLLRGALEIGQQLGLASQRAAAIAALLGCLALGLCIELPLVAGALRLGRTLELRLRMAFLAKIPRLDDRYFRSRLLSDMAERGHALHQVRGLPQLGVRLFSASAQLLLTVIGIAWLRPASVPFALIAAVLCIGVPLASQPLLAERDLRMRSHAGMLARFYLDALLGLLAIRVHGARSAMQHQQAALLVSWARASMRLYSASVLVEGVLALSGLGMAAMMVWSVSSHSSTALLLLIYWALSLPALGQEIAIVVRQYPALRNVVGRLLEPLGTPEPVESASTASAVEARGQPGDRAAARGVAIRMSGVSVEAAGTTVLKDVDLALAPGEQVAIVGPSGAGKSTLVGLLLGWYRPAAGSVEVDGRPLVGERQRALRQVTAWVDPAVALWNRSFLDNLRYGADDGDLPLAEILSRAQLRDVLAHLPDGLSTELGEAGAAISGGEGQRTRVGRALARTQARLVVLDEPFRGLDLPTRREMLAMVQRWWRDATLLWVTHDIAETERFARVLVVDGGRIVEDGHPGVLCSQAGSRYATLMRGDHEMHAKEWSVDQWRRVWIEGGKVREDTVGS